MMHVVVKFPRVSFDWKNMLIQFLEQDFYGAIE
jgi:hypothetical protein